MTDFWKMFKTRISKSLVYVLTKILKNKPPKIISEEMNFLGGLSQSPELMLGTKSGLMYTDGKIVKRLIAGRVYGITKYKNRWYIAINKRLYIGNKPISSVGSIVSFVFEKRNVSDVRVEYAPLDTDIHQIDCYGSYLFITDTSSNRVIRFLIEKNGLSHREDYYPAGALEYGRRSKNYAHINSIYIEEKKIYLMLHNDTTKTGKKSVVGIYDNEFNLLEIKNIGASCAHNVVPHDGKISYCDSVDGTFVGNDRVLFQKPYFLRGVAEDGGNWYVGASDFSTKSGRSVTQGKVFLYKKQSNEMEELTVPEMGSLYEIRLINKEDLGLSSCGNITSSGNI